MALARLTGGPLDGQIVPLDDSVEDSYIVGYGEGQLVYERSSDLTNTGESDGPTEAVFTYAETTEDIDPNIDGRDD
ncbi:MULTISPECIES: response regulator [unclassified Microbacterium]|uniref:response regulator n=1 Tax=unclassified Microbacterium TaxID=2609290 RepID=UPI0037461F42